MEALLPKAVSLSGGSPGSKEMQLQLLLGLQLINKSLKKPAKPLQPHKEGETSSSSESESSPSPPALMENPRKRKLPSDLNDESDKREKKKMMNRIAAQNARDRKKNYLESLEKKLALLEEENKKLKEENASLKSETVTLSAQKDELEKRLSDKEEGDGEIMVCGGSAVPLVSLPQKPIPSSLNPSLLYHFLMIINLIYYLCWFQKLTQTAHHANLSPSMTHIASMERFFLPMPPAQRWWGPQQTGWNPPMN
ncbi:PREDICTED: X-box-binding protein 1-like [Amphimedon queenslandica]|uniref:X-box-binding protein 1 n=1 Tax=Amphimedon queenslandica TaxID=400682 RepID=A0A1X7V9B4_AMPQE|nr:PREDICTED: X-box-binding protein 1-like [Amphimedon queenslandica]|eukprot:XP_003385243.1 PREDICTED: X-box-binding protein 1-like [Amphimedon queenslandica]